MRPSFIAGGINGILLLVVIIMTSKYWEQLDNYQKIIAVSLIAIQFGIHAGIHHVEEIKYGFNPIKNIRFPQMELKKLKATPKPKSRPTKEEEEDVDD